jgi:hypothetical protein
VRVLVCPFRFDCDRVVGAPVVLSSLLALFVGPGYCLFAAVRHVVLMACALIFFIDIAVATLLSPVSLALTGVWYPVVFFC